MKKRPKSRITHGISPASTSQIQSNYSKEHTMWHFIKSSSSFLFIICICWKTSTTVTMVLCAVSKLTNYSEHAPRYYCSYYEDNWYTSTDQELQKYKVWEDMTFKLYQMTPPIISCWSLTWSMYFNSRTWFTVVSPPRRFLGVISAMNTGTCSPYHFRRIIIFFLNMVKQWLFTYS